ncbi:DUF4864 domain-containing protein [Tropicimonas sp. IMCC6043]|uniref:DUF4864 domain-containing protein n=1 Tax=Tropicimonas sp. IMCC6043 TaxID=2510645 RepID=UPI00101DD7AF|nr:DUF4864 domain-containing protein [Tropicimonas sp. IMCC6043]RYH10089.1 DUF4864 domain-containing protein [Tropicimonas sp. IMCC6043]
MFIRRSLFAAALVLAASASAAQQAASDAIRLVIRDQIAHFQNDDWTQAFDYASPAIRDLFRTPENFGRMVREGYPMVWRPTDMRFGTLNPRPGRSLQRVVLFDSAGVPHALEYEMIETDSGWKINGVRFLQAEAGA